MNDPVHSLAFTIQANRGVYAVLLGSGISRAAGISTGWEITLDLVRKLAELCEEVATLSWDAAALFAGRRSGRIRTATISWSTIRGTG